MQQSHRTIPLRPKTDWLFTEPPFDVHVQLLTKTGISVCGKAPEVDWDDHFVAWSPDVIIPSNAN